MIYFKFSLRVFTGANPKDLTRDQDGAALLNFLQGLEFQGIVEELCDWWKNGCKESDIPKVVMPGDKEGNERRKELRKEWKESVKGLEAKVKRKEKKDQNSNADITLKVLFDKDNSALIQYLLYASYTVGADVVEVAKDKFGNDIRSCLC